LNEKESGIMATALIVYASLTGNTEEIADILAESLEEQGEEDANFKPIYNCDSYDDYYCNAGYRQ